MWRYDQNANGTVASTERFFYMYDDRWRIVGAFWDSGSTPQESFVYHAAGNAGRGSSSYIDSVVMRDRDTDANGTLEERRYYVQNWRADVVAITKSNGDPLQYVVYSPYGEPVTHAAADVDLDGDVDSNDQTAWANGAPNSTFAYAALEDLNHDGTDSAADDALFDESYGDNVGLSGRGRLTASKLDNRKGYAGYEHDESLTMYHVRNRVYRPDLGRWMSRDPLGYVDGMGLYEYARGMAVRGSDPSGLFFFCSGCTAWVAGTQSWQNGRHTRGTCLVGVGDCCSCMYVPCTTFTRTCPWYAAACNTTFTDCLMNTPAAPNVACIVDIPVLPAPFGAPGAQSCPEMCAQAGPPASCGNPIGPTVPGAPGQQTPIRVVATSSQIAESGRIRALTPSACSIDRFFPCSYTTPVRQNEV